MIDEENTVEGTADNVQYDEVIQKVQSATETTVWLGEPE